MQQAVSERQLPTCSLKTCHVPEADEWKHTMNCSAHLHPCSQVLTLSVPTQPVTHLSRATVLMPGGLLGCWTALHWQRLSLSIEHLFKCEVVLGSVSKERYFRASPRQKDFILPLWGGVRPATSATMPQCTQQLPMPTSEGLEQ